MLISIDLRGGLGNQLFMIFTAFAHSMQYDKQVIFRYQLKLRDRYTYWDSFLNTLKKYTTYNIDNNISNSELVSCNRYMESNFFFTPIPNFDKNTMLDGYFQSFKYFDNYKNEILSIIDFQNKQQHVRNKYCRYFEGKQTVSIHFRMGDYKKIRYFHPIMNYEYYENSLLYIVNKIKQPMRILYFCEKEDNLYVESKISIMKCKIPELEFVKVDDTIPDYEQMIIISLCSHNIMSNSTFSWWGSYLNNNENNIVCYPSVWFGEHAQKPVNNQDLFLPNWKEFVANPIHWSQPLS